MRVGFIGLGNIGTPMAQQIASAGFPLVVHDVRKDAAAALVQQGARDTISKCAYTLIMYSDIIKLLKERVQIVFQLVCESHLVKLLVLQRA